MCGIAGLTKGIADSDNIGGMMMALRERGPDYNEFKSFDPVTLIHARLKIIDLSAVANQPMTNEDGTIWLLFNGEIYNYRKLREKLVAKGHSFKSQTDSEVIIHLYEEMGEDLWIELEGMFAIALYDSVKKKLFVCRDRFGIKPLFYYSNNGEFAFASNINSIKNVKGVDLTVDPQAIFDFTAFLYIPAPLTFYKNIRALIPGEYLVLSFNDDKVASTEHKFFHKWEVDKLNHASEETVSEQLNELFNKAVSSEIESDVPLGALLSGGIDSSLVCAMAQKELGSKPLNTFNVKFPDAINDETWAAVAVAEHIGSRHITLKMDSKSGSWEELVEVLGYCGQPFADTSIFAVSKVAELISKHVTVCLSGDGGDEAFSGYATHLQVEKVNQVLSLPGPIKSLVFACARLYRFMPQPFRDKLRAINYFRNEDHTGIIQNFHVWLRNEEHKQLILQHNSYKPVRRFFEPILAKASKVSDDSTEVLSMAISLARTELHLPNDYLFKVDSGTMKSSIENRVPFLNESLFNFGLRLPHKLKLKHKTNKYLLRKLAAKELPEKIIKKPKGGFGLPVDLWVNEECRKRIVHEISSSEKLPLYLNRKKYMEWVHAFEQNKQLPGVSREGLYQRIIMLTSLNLHL